MSSAFDPQLFLDAQQTEVNVKRPPLPQLNPTDTNGYYTAMIGQVEMASGTIGKGERAGQPWLAAKVPLTIEVPQQVQDQMGVKLTKGTVTVTDFVMLDLTPDGRGLDNSVGRNGRQRQYRDALDLNKPGDTFSWRIASGRPIKCRITWDMYNGEPIEKIGLLGRV